MATFVSGGQGAMSAPNTVPPAPTQQPQTMQQLLPQLNSMLNTASGNINNLLSGVPSPAVTRSANASFGAATGMPATTGGGSFIGNRAYDLYGQQAMQNQQTGLSDLLNLIGGTSGTVATTPGQQLQNQQFNTSAGNQSDQFQQSLALQQFNAMLNALGLGQNIVSSDQTQIPAFNL
jgi:hypothetical protein